MSGITTAPAAPGRRSSPEPERPRQAIVLAILVAFQLMVATDLTVANIALPGIQASLGFSQVNLAWVINAYTLAFGGLLLLGGRIGDAYGRRRSFVAGVVLFTVASLLAGMATSATWLLAARVAQGAGSAVAAAGALALITSNFPDGAARNRAMGVYAASGALGASVGLIVGGILTDWASWRWVLWINVPVGVVIAAVTGRFVRDAGRQVARLDVAGAVTSTLGVTALVYGFIRAASDGWGDAWALGGFVSALGLMGLFLVVERRATEPLVPLRLLGDRDRNLAYAITMLLVATVFGAFFFLTQFLQEVLGYGPLQTGMAFLPLTGAIMALSGSVSRVMGRFGPRVPIAGGALLALGAALWISRLSAETGYWAGVAGPMALMGVGMAGVIGPITVIMMGRVAGPDAGAASGLAQVTQQIGISVGLALLVTVYGTASRDAAASFAGDDPVARGHHALAEGVGSAYVLGSVFAGAAFLMALLLPRRLS